MDFQEINVVTVNGQQAGWDVTPMEGIYMVPMGTNELLYSNGDEWQLKLHNKEWDLLETHHGLVSGSNINLYGEKVVIPAAPVEVVTEQSIDVIEEKSAVSLEEKPIEVVSGYDEVECRCCGAPMDVRPSTGPHNEYSVGFSNFTDAEVEMFGIDPCEYNLVRTVYRCCSECKSYEM